MSQRLVMNYRHPSLGQRFTPSPCQEGQGIAGSLGLEEAALPVPGVGSPQHGQQTQQKERGRRKWKDPKILASSWTETTWWSPPRCCCLCSVHREVSSTQGCPGHADAKGPVSQFCSAIPFWHASDTKCETEIQGPSINAAHSHIQSREFVNLLGTGYTRGYILYFIQYFILFPILPCLLSLLWKKC